jgi:leucyl-tRNA synthetase
MKTGGDWDDSGIKGIDRFLQRSYRLVNKDVNTSLTTKDIYIYNLTVKNITMSIDSMKFNTAISKLMEFVNHFYDKGLNETIRNNFITLLSPFAPHLSEELWEISNNKKSVFNEKWPIFDESKIVLSTISIAIQVNGKLRGNIDIDIKTSKDEILELAKSHNNVVNYILDKNIIKKIYVPGKIINFVVK